MNKKFSRRNFIQTAAVTTAAAVVPTYAGASINPGTSSSKPLADELPKRRLGRTNRMVSCIGFGAGSKYCNWVADEKTLQQHIDYAIKLGITYFDAARVYGKGLAEERYGKYLIPKYRAQIFLNSKSSERTYDGVMKDIETSLSLLKTDHLDLYCIHAIDQMEQVDQLLKPDGGYKAFLKLRREGTVKNLGFSYHKWNEASQKAFNEFDVDVVMCPINATKYTGSEDNMIPLAQKRDLGIIAIKILGQNALIGNVSGDDLVRFALSLPITVANIGMDGFSPLLANTNVGREPVIDQKEAKRIQNQLNFDPKVTRLPYFTG